MSNRLFQGIIHQMRDTIDRTIGVVDESSVIIACSELGKIGEVCEEITPEEFDVSYSRTHVHIRLTGEKQ